MVKVKCYYMAYACGECQPQYQIFAVNDAGPFSREELMDLDINVIFNSKDLETQIDSLVHNCIICFDFSLSGVLRKETKAYTLYADECSVKTRFKDCCD